MSEQLIFNFPFKKNYSSQEFYVASNNFDAFKLIESWPKWTSRFVNIFGPKGCGKTHLANILMSKIQCIMVPAKKIDEQTLNKFKTKECLIIDDFTNNIDEKVLYSALNQTRQIDNYIVINSDRPIKDLNFNLKDLQSRAKSFLSLGIDFPTDDLLRVIISKSFSDKQIAISPKVSEYIIKNIDRSYDQIFKFLKEIDEISLSSGKSININLIKKVLNDK